MRLSTGTGRGRAVALPALALAMVLAGTGAAAPPPELDLPWGAIGAGLTVVDVVSTPIRAVWRPVLSAASEVPVLDRIGRPAEQVLGLVDAGLPLAVEGSALAGRLADSWPSVSQVESAGSPAWQLSPLPDVSPSLGSMGSLVDGLRSRLDSAAACDCLGSAADSRLGAWATTAADASWALSSFGPLVAAFDDVAGFDEPRTYLVVIGNQAEMRPSGGAPLYAAVVTADSGLIRIADKGTTSSHFFPPMNAPVTWTGPVGNPYFAANPRTMPFVSAGANPDFSVSAQEMAAAFEAGGHPPVDGVIYVDMTLLQQVLDLTGPVEVDGLGAVDATSLVPQVLDNAYDDAGSVSDNQRRQAANDALFDALLARVSSGLPPRETLQVLEDAVAGRHLQAWFRDSATQSVFDSSGWTGVLAAPDTTDWLAWYTQNGNPSKTDIRQARSVSRTVAAEGSSLRIDTEYAVVNENAPGGGTKAAEKRGYQATWMRTAVVAYLPGDAASVTAVGLDGMEPAPLEGVEFDGTTMTDAEGHRFVRFVGWIPPQSSARVEVSYTLPAPADGEPYSLTLEPQAAITPYTATVSVAGGEPPAFGPTEVDERMLVEVALAAPLP